MRQLCKGNVAIIKGAILAGCRSFYGYPITPASEIAEAAALKLDLPPNALERYLYENIDFTLDSENLEGLKLYFEQCAAAGLIPRARPIEFAAAAPEAARRAQETH